MNQILHPYNIVSFCYNTFKEKYPELTQNPNNHLKILDISEDKDNITSWKPISIPKGSISFRLGSSPPPNSVNIIKTSTDYYKQQTNPRFFGDLETVVRYYSGDGNINQQDIHMVMFDNIILADINCLANQVMFAYNEELKKKLDTYLRIDYNAARLNLIGMKTNPHNLLITKRGDTITKKNNRSNTYEFGFGNPTYIKQSESYEGIEDRIKFLAFFITYGICPISQIEIAVDAYNFEVASLMTKQKTNKPKIDNRDIQPINIDWFLNFTGVNDLLLSDSACRNQGKDPPPSNLAGLSYRLSIGALDDIACDFLKTYAKRFGIDGYYSFKQFVPWGINREHRRTEKFQFHSEICLFTPKDKIIKSIPMLNYCQSKIHQNLYLDSGMWYNLFNNTGESQGNYVFEEWYRKNNQGHSIFKKLDNIIKLSRNYFDVISTNDNISTRNKYTKNDLEDTFFSYKRIENKIKGKIQILGGTKKNKKNKKILKKSNKSNKD